MSARCPRYWMVSTPGEEVHLHANDFVVDSGALVLRDDEGLSVAAFAPGMWREVHAASQIDGGRIYEEHRLRVPVARKAGRP